MPKPALNVKENRWNTENTLALQKPASISPLWTLGIIENGLEEHLKTPSRNTLTLERILANFKIDNLPTQPNGGGTWVGTYRTGVFEGAIFKGTFDTIMIPQGEVGILKIQFGSGEIKFPILQP